MLVAFKVGLAQISSTYFDRSKTAAEAHVLVCAGLFAQDFKTFGFADLLLKQYSRSRIFVKMKKRQKMK